MDALGWTIGIPAAASKFADAEIRVLFTTYGSEFSVT